MLKVELEFYRGILFIRLRGVFTKKYIDNIKLDDILNVFKFKYVVFNIDNIRLIDGYGIGYLINYNYELKKYDGKAVICQETTLFLDKFVPKIDFIRSEKEVFNQI